MNSKTIGMLAAITVVVLLAAVILTQQQPDGIPQAGERLFPELKARLNEVKDIVVSTKDQTIHVTRQESGWVVKEKSGYRASMAQVRPALIGLADLTILEPKTRKPDLYEKLGLQDVNAEGSSSTLVTLKDGEGKLMAELLMGDQRLSKSDSSKQEIYVRKPGNPQTWLVLGKLKMETTPDGWMEKQILDIDLQRVHQVRVAHPGGETVTLKKAKPTDTDFALEELPKGAKIQSQFSVNNIAETIAQFTIEDVVPEKEAKVKFQGATRTVLETLDGLRVTFQIAKMQDDKHYATVSAEFDPATIYSQEEPIEKGKEGASSEKEPAQSTPPLPLRSQDEVQREVEALNNQLKPWVFSVPQFRVDGVTKRLQDLTTKET